MKREKMLGILLGLERKVKQLGQEKVQGIKAREVE